MIKSLKLADYKEPNYLIPNVYLEVDIQDSFTEVTGRFQLENNPNTSESEIFLHGINLELISIQLDDAVLPADSFKKTDQGISLKLTKPTHQLEIKVRNKPHENKELEGLYKSSDLFVTQMEAEGFRRFCYFMDRPDVLSIYEVKLLASKERFPTLLANGDKSEEGALEGGRHYSIWKDPSPKPCYLFAIVAGKLSSIKDKFVTSSGKDVALEIYSENQYKERLAYSMEYLKQSMKWDQDRYNLEYDLNTYMIVAADNFNAGAMENKGLNIFNTRLLLADQNTATENNLYTIQSVVGHEYFHNWSGNRVTCKNWFQLSLKEGLTVYRDQEFTSDLNSRTVKRIEDVVTLRTAQFPEDLGPNSHPIRPEEVINMANFYTPTVYEKGSEVIRMIHTLIGEHEFQKGLKDYFSRFDGQAVTCDDFVDCMERNSSFDFSEFRKWYSTRGTPLVKIEISYSNEEQKYSLEKKKKNLKDESASYLPIPLKIAFFHKSSGQRTEMKHYSISKNSEGDDYVLLTGEKLNIELENTEDLYLSINRDFSAPVIIETNQSAEELEFLAQNDDNFFNRYESIQKLYLEELNKRLTGDTFISDLPNLVEQILAIADRDEALCNLA
ncbi:MAG: aminopeptidase N, partial [Bdellovibrionales bacterium]